MNSIHYVLKSHEIIPKTLKQGEFFKEHGLKMVKDIDLTDKLMKKICKQIKIEHEFSEGIGQSQMVVDGLNIRILKDNKLTDLINLSPKNKSIVFAKEDGVFNPVYVKTEGNKHGLFKPNNDILDNMFN